MDLAFTINTGPATNALKKIVKQIPFAMSTGINDLLRQVRVAENAAMSKTFKHPRPFTAKSVLYDQSTKASLSGTVYVRPEVAKYLQPYETGGVHVLPGKALLNPVNINLDAYGQLPKATMARLRARKDIYIGVIKTKSGAEITGVWQRVAVGRGGGKRRKRLPGGRIFDAALGPLKLLIRLGDALEVKQHLDFVKRGTALIETAAPAVFKAAFAKALGTAIP